MEQKIIKIGNSKGIRLSKTILEKYNIGDKVEISLNNDGILITPIKNPRSGWEEAFKALENDEGQNLMDDVFDDENFEEW
ncbi:AbrB/MazE/SpoVT family DNA-binding domain-containing protein [Flammeovirga sp. EKP202]|uniref:AbrB/MazE/SpoVT family DNA-binding domain-containing protein n=1 Tax=Flammeovirga sp. EKP202 TaxID=2770592 RepID=UPI00165F78F4|nr:AbrB/MazE/SpoVT family DNA-binding domain-containing protein [Flammeovirga sp. EKP202]MBD0403259.1 AbrB/MazE/SpoVT family DNA-binding domain-containing protein [Flammeovirga sp. EKP202]